LHELRRQDFYTGLIIIVISLFVLVESWRMPRHIQDWPLYAAPGMVTGLLGLGFLAMGMILTIRSTRREGAPLAFKRSEISAYLNDPKTHRLGLMFALSLIYCLLLGRRLPYVVVTTIYLFVVMVVFKGPGLVKFFGIFKLLIISLATAMAVGVVFNRFFLIPLP
jgi:hypothetical protein